MELRVIFDRQLALRWQPTLVGKLPSVTEFSTDEVAPQQFCASLEASLWLEEHATSDRPCST